MVLLNKTSAKITLLNPSTIIRVKQIVHRISKNLIKKIKKSLDKWLIRSSMNPHTSPAFMVRNHAEEKRGKARMVINYKKLNDNTIFDGCYVPNKTILFQNSKSLLVLLKDIMS